MYRTVSLGKLKTTTALLAALLVLPLASQAASPATTACKECVMKCVMGTGKLFRECIRPNPVYEKGECDTLCPGIDRLGLKAELKAIAKQTCENELVACRKEAGDDIGKALNCEGNYGICSRNYNGFNDFH